MKRLLTWLVVILVVGGIVWLFIAMVNRQNQADNKVVNVPAITEADWVAGNKDSSVTLVEYGDFQCPACGAYHPFTKRLITEQETNFRFVYRHFPLSQHVHARPAAYAAEAAGKQGKFWEMYDLIFENQNKWSSLPNAANTYEVYATQLELNLEQFKKDRDSDAIKDKVNSDNRGALGIGVNSTPSFYLNGKKIQPASYQGFADLIKAAQPAAN